MELDSPAEAGLGVGGEDEAGVGLDAERALMGIHRGGRLLGREHSCFGWLWFFSPATELEEIQEQIKRCWA